MIVAKPICHFLASPVAAVVDRLTRENPDSEPDRFKPFTLIGILLTAISSLLAVAIASAKLIVE